MAEFSKEYLDLIRSETIPDFSYTKELIDSPNELNIYRICEGFGSVGVTSISDEIYLLFLNSDSKPLSEVINHHSNGRV